MSFARFNKKAAAANQSNLTSSANDIKAGLRNRVEVHYLNMKIKKLEKEKAQAIFLADKTIHKIEQHLENVKANTGSYYNKNYRKLNASQAESQHSKKANPNMDSDSENESDSDSSGDKTDDETDNENKKSSTSNYKDISIRLGPSIDNTPTNQYQNVSFRALKSQLNYTKKRPEEILFERIRKPKIDVQKFQQETQIQRINLQYNLDKFREQFPEKPVNQPLSFHDLLNQINYNDRNSRIHFPSLSTGDVNRIRDLKSKDPIYKKRSQHFEITRMFGKAPRLGKVETNIKTRLSKAVLEKKRNEMIRASITSEQLLQQLKKPTDNSSQKHLKDQISLFVKKCQLIT